MKSKVFLIFLILIVICVYKKSEQNIFIPDASIRLRVIPNSNNPEDIYIKEKVKDYLETDIYSLTKNINDIDTARNIISSNLSEIDKNVGSILNEYHYPLGYNVNYGYNYFPKKIYRGITYKEGYYESLVISIGNAEGDNWWCVLFPNFCIDDSVKTPEYKSYIKELISKYSKNKIKE